jgi:hypothetical protein
MAAINSGSVLLSKAVLKSESTFGTSPSFTSGGRRLNINPTGYITTGVTVDDQSDKSIGLLVRGVGSRATITAKMPTISLSAPALSVNELAIYMAGVENVAPGVAGSAAIGTAGLNIPGTANVWDFTLGTAFLAGNVSPKSYSIVATGGNGNPGVEQYLLNYVLPTKISIKAADGLTTATIDAFGQTLAKNTTVLADTLPTDVVNMAGRLWKAYYYTSAANFTTDASPAASTATVTNVTASGGTVTYTAANTFTAGQPVLISGINPTAYNGVATIATATGSSFTVLSSGTGTYVSGGPAVATNVTAAISGGSAFAYISDWGLDLETPNKPLAYLAGTVSFTGHSSQANNLNGTISLTVSGGTDAIAQIFDAYNAATPTYWRFNWTDGQRIVDILAAVVFTDVQPLAGDNDGVTNITATGTMVYDTTAASAGRIRIISDTLSVLP